MALQRSNQVAVDQSAVMRGMLARIDGGRSALREARAAKGGRFDVVLGKEDTEAMLSEAVGAGPPLATLPSPWQGGHRGHAL